MKSQPFPFQGDVGTPLRCSAANGPEPMRTASVRPERSEGAHGKLREGAESRLREPGEGRHRGARFRKAEK